MGWSAADVAAKGAAHGCVGCEYAAPGGLGFASSGLRFSFHDDIDTPAVEAGAAARAANMTSNDNGTQPYHVVHTGCVAQHNVWWLMYPPKSVRVST